ncbi:MAG TPA: gamma-glutamyl-gamma-aminobutyrate hydrolase family protein [Acidimicrobiales bacterium]|nr:gamma-glutamyl-gamma-aminobutyrate hydrolase family protein [Acidimicrobiales bacterium]
MGKPLIGITGRRWPATTLGHHVPYAMNDLHFDLHFTDYPRSVALAGGLPVELARDADVDALVERLDGLVLSGGADVDPDLYGAEPDVNLGAVERERDEWELALFSAARRLDLPILAICRGFQLLNVALGGTLNQHVELDEGAGHPQWDVDGRTPTHSVNVVAGTRTASILPSTWPVNSLHHQTVETVGEGLIITARASDGVVEGVESPDGSVLAVQWHPEMLGHPDPTFAWLVAEASSRMAKVRN